jgi:hypothetical protein
LVIAGRGASGVVGRATVVTGWSQCGQFADRSGSQGLRRAGGDARGCGHGPCLLFTEADGPLFIAGLAALFSRRAGSRRPGARAVLNARTWSLAREDWTWARMSTERLPNPRPQSKPRA